ncbi:MAG: hypothetical protein ABIT09_02050 [Croceibacterium sp.]
MSEEAPPANGSGAMMRFRKKSHLPRLAPDNAKRQGDITQLAFQRLGREGAIAFLNEDNAALGGRPLDVAMESAEGSARVAAELALRGTPET